MKSCAITFLTTEHCIQQKDDWGDTPESSATKNGHTKIVPSGNSSLTTRVHARGCKLRIKIKC